MRFFLASSRSVAGASVLVALPVAFAAASCGGGTLDGSSESPLGASALAGTWDLTASARRAWSPAAAATR